MNHPACLLLALLLILCIPLVACAEAVESPRASASAPANPAGTARSPGPSSDRPGPITRKTNAPPRPRLARADRGGAPFAPVSFRLRDAPRRYPPGAKQR